MMDGYSVQDAASVLGVPEGRVWELLARGVISGTPEGDSMRVFLKADAAPLQRPAPREELPRSNGNGGSHGAEASAFRELLTEFRNLTERYGQALLALGEARGEVAGLRSRVELLEARIDLRLASRTDSEPIAWDAPASRAAPPVEPEPSVPAPEAPSPPQVEVEVEAKAVMPAPAPAERGRRARKPKSTRAAVAGFAEALARAQDPNLADVGQAPAEADASTEPEPIEAAPLSDAIAESTEPQPIDEPPFPEVTAESTVREEEDATASLAAAPQAVEPAASPEASYSTTVVEPDWFADGDFSWLDAADLEARSQPEAPGQHAVEPAAASAEPAPEAQAEAVADPRPDAAPAEPEGAAAHQFEAIVMPEPAPDPEPLVEAWAPAEPDVAVELAPEPEPPMAPAFDRMEAVEMSAAGEEAVMWLGGPGDAAEEAADDQAVATPGSHPGPTLAPRIRDALEQVAWPPGGHPVSAAVAAPAAPAVAPPLAMTEAELAQLARDEGWDDAEVAAIRAMISRPSNSTVELPGSAELEQAMSALQAVPIESSGEPTPERRWTKPAASAEVSRQEEWAFEVEPFASRPPATQPPLATRRAAADPTWLRTRRGPAASAYRRIRRIFTG